VGGGRVRGVARALAHRPERRDPRIMWLVRARAASRSLPPEAQASEAARLRRAIYTP